MPSAKPSFSGFSKDLPLFLSDLQRNNKKAWFDAHRQDYEALYLNPAKAFVESLGAALPKSFAGLRAEPRVGGSIMRINRDIRFSKDKRPYKDAMHFIFGYSEGRMADTFGFYLRITSDNLEMAAGKLGLDSAELATFREQVVDPKAGKALRQAIEKVRKAGPYDLPDPHYKRIPRGFDADHANADLLLHRGIFLRTQQPHPAALFDKRAVPFVVDRFKEMHPIPKWIGTHLI